MSVGAKLTELRKRSGLTQEELAEKLAVSRQAVSRWENCSTLPDAANLLALSRLYKVSADYLLDESAELDEDLPRLREDKTILHANLTRIAIIVQAAFLNAFAQPWNGAGENRTLEYVLKLVPLLLASLWMASNHRFERDPVQRLKNTKIEMLYCFCQTAVALTGYYRRWTGLTALLIISVALFYIFYVNPRYMNRQLVRKKH